MLQHVANDKLNKINLRKKLLIRNCFCWIQLLNIKHWLTMAEESNGESTFEFVEKKAEDMSITGETTKTG